MSAPLNTPPRLAGTGPLTYIAPKAERYKGIGDPNGRFLGYKGDQYVDLETGSEWQKRNDNDGKPDLVGWELSSSSLAMLKEENLADVADAPTARTNLNVTTIYAGDYGAIADYSGTQNTAGTGTDNRAFIQAALDAAYTQGPGGVADTTNNISYKVVIPKGKYYIGARSDGMPSLSVPLKVDLDFSEAELHFEIPPRTFTANGITEPNPAWCAILIGPFSGLTIGKMQIVANRDQTYGGTWFGLNLDAVRVQESDIAFIRGGGREHYILGFTRGAAIRCIATYNTFISELNVSSCAFGLVQSFFGTAFSGYTRYRGTSHIESVCTSIWVSDCSFLNIFRYGIMCGVNGAWNAPASGGFENVTSNDVGDGPVAIHHCAFENCANGAIYVQAIGSVYIRGIRLERIGPVGDGGLSAIFAGLVRSFSIDGVDWHENGGTCFQASYTAAHASITPNPSHFIRVNATNVSPNVRNVRIHNNANTLCQLVNGDNNITRLPIVENYRAETGDQMQGTNSYMQSIVLENDGGRIWSVSTVGLAPSEAVNGSRTTFTFLNGLTRQKPKRIVVDGLTLEATDVAGTNWTWNTSTTDVTFATAPTKSVRAFF